MKEGGFICMLFLAVVLCSSVDTFSGDVTFYTEWKTNYGSCGLEISRKDPFQVAALSRKYMNLPPGKANPNLHPLCTTPHCLRITGVRGSIVVRVSDTCKGCRGDDVDVADAVYHLLDDPNKGRVRMQWTWVNCPRNLGNELFSDEIDEIAEIDE